MVETAILAKKSSNTDQVPPPLVVFQIPPPTLPAYHVDVVTESMTMARTRPPMLPGPSQVQLVVAIPAEVADSRKFWARCPERMASTCALASIKALGGILPFSSTIRI